MGITAIFSAALKSAETAVFRTGALGAAQSDGAQALGAGHVDLDAGAHHPLWVGEEPRAKAPSLGKAVLQQISHVSSTPVGAWLDAMPSHPALAPLQLAGNLIRSAAGGENHRVVVTGPNKGLGGYLGTPQGPTFLPGGSPIPPPQRKEEFLADPEAMEPVTEGKLAQQWPQQRPEQLVPVRAKWSDFVHLASKSDDSAGPGAESARELEIAASQLEEIFSPQAIQEGALHDVLNALRREPQTNSFSIAEHMSVTDAPNLESLNNSGVLDVTYAPHAVIDGLPYVVKHAPWSEIESFTRYGASGVYTANAFGNGPDLMLDLNADSFHSPEMSAAWGSSEQIVDGLFRKFAEQGMELPATIWLRPGEIQSAVGAEAIRAIQEEENLLSRQGVYGKARMHSLSDAADQSLSGSGYYEALKRRGYGLVTTESSAENGNILAFANFDLLKRR